MELHGKRMIVSLLLLKLDHAALMLDEMNFTTLPRRFYFNSVDALLDISYLLMMIL